MVEQIDFILENCPNYDIIANYISDDEITNTIINFYKDFVFSTNDIEVIKKIDKILGEYINNDKLFKYIKENFMDKIPTISLEDLLINLYNNYNLETMKQINSTHWV